MQVAEKKKLIIYAVSVNYYTNQNFFKSYTRDSEILPDHAPYYRFCSVNIVTPHFVLCMCMSYANNGNADLIIYIGSEIYMSTLHVWTFFCNQNSEK